MLSSKGKYALRAVMMLARCHASQGWTATSEIAGHEQIPRKFLEAILVQLRDGNLVVSRRGSRGGHRLAGEPATISVADVIRLIDGPLALTPCASVARFQFCTDCHHAQTCPLQPVMQQARDAVAGVLENCSLSSLLDTAATAKAPIGAASRESLARVAPRPRSAPKSRTLAAD